MVDAEQGRRKLPRGGAAIVRSIGGRAAADSVFLIIQLSCLEIAFVASRYIDGHALTSCIVLYCLSQYQQRSSTQPEIETHDHSLVPSPPLAALSNDCR